MRLLECCASIIVVFGLLWLSMIRAAEAARLEKPIEFGAIETPGNVLGVSVVGGIAYVADCSLGLRVIDISNPGARVELRCMSPGYLEETPISVIWRDLRYSALLVVRAGMKAEI